ncbi:MAG TPA: hypothetical protein VMH38_00605 [Thermoplasmata archaeon]|nr:hypothetical protein [Thermoplasmata archaeon]
MPGLPEVVYDGPGERGGAGGAFPRRARRLRIHDHAGFTARTATATPSRRRKVDEESGPRADTAPGAAVTTTVSWTIDCCPTASVTVVVSL